MRHNQLQRKLTKKTAMAATILVGAGLWNFGVQAEENQDSDNGRYVMICSGSEIKEVQGSKASCDSEWQSDMAKARASGHPEWAPSICACVKR